jgi:hypothetical protein
LRRAFERALHRTAQPDTTAPPTIVPPRTYN